MNSPEENMPMTIEFRYNKNDYDGYVVMAKTIVPKAVDCDKARQIFLARIHYSLWFFDNFPKRSLNLFIFFLIKILYLFSLNTNSVCMAWQSD